MGKDATVDYRGKDNGFLVRVVDGTTRTVEFDSDDGLVIMLGDGDKEVVNPALVENGEGRCLCALPHSLATCS